MPLKSPSPTYITGNLIAGQYRVEGVLGQGGFGVVYRAVHTTHQREVALKVLRSNLLAQPDLLQRFLREAELAKRLAHPNTVRIYDFGADGGVAYIAYEMLRGRPLSAVIKAEAPLPPARVAHIAAQVLASLMEAHAAGIIHRDIKPANIFLCDFPGAPDFVKVLDFGIAKASLPPGQTMQALTQAGEMLGTPHYMAPEQAHGYSITPAADLYALGIMMSEALSGAPVLRGTAMEIVMAQVSPSPLPHRPEVLHSTLGPVVQRATQKDPASRYASAEEMLRHIESLRGAHEAPRGSLASPAEPPPGPPPPSTIPGMSVGPTMPPATVAAAFAPPMPAPTYAAMPAQPTYAAPVAPASGSSGRTLAIGLGAAGALIIGCAAAFLWGRASAGSGGEDDPTALRSKAPGAAASLTPTSPLSAASSAPDPAARGGGATAKTAKSPAGGQAQPTGTAAASATPTATASAAAGGGAPFDAPTASASMDAAYQASRGCYSGPPMGVGVSVLFGKDGRASSVQLISAVSHTPPGNCITNSFKACSTKPYDEPELRSVTKSYQY